MRTRSASGPPRLALAAACVAAVAGCSGHAAKGAAGTTSSPPLPTVSPSSVVLPASNACGRTDLAARFAGGGMGTGNDFGSIVVWNAGADRCRVAGAVTFTAYFRDGRRDVNARPNRPVPAVDVVLPAHMPAYRDGADPSGYLTADLMGPERDDPSQPDALCREQDKLAPDVLVLTIGRLTFRVSNSDPQSLQVKQAYGCHGTVLLEGVQRAPQP